MLRVVIPAAKIFFSIVESNIFLSLFLTKCAFFTKTIDVSTIKRYNLYNNIGGIL